MIHSSISSVLGGLGLSAYAGANAVLDSIATRGGPTWLSIGWDAWDNAAEAQMAGMPTAIQPPEGQEAFLRRAARAAWGRAWSIAVGDLDGRLESWVRRSEAAKPAAAVDRHPRPNLATPFVEPATETETRARRDLGLPARARQGRRPRPLLRPGRPLPAGGAGGVGDPRPLPDRDAGAPALQGADHPRAGGAGRAGRAHRRRRRRWPRHQPTPTVTADAVAVPTDRPRARPRDRAISPRRATASSTTTSAGGSRRRAWARRRSS